MKKTSMLKWAILAIGIICSLFILSKGPKETLGFVLGLDLRGGVSFVVQIDEDGLKKELGEKWIDANPSWRAAGVDTQAKVDEKYAEERGTHIKEAQERALQVIRSRVNGLGIREAQIYAERDSRIVIQLPGVDAETRADAEATLGEVGRLSFHLVHPDNERLVEKMLTDELAPPDFKIALVPDGRGGTERGYAFAEGTQNADSHRAIRALNPRGDYELMMMRRESRDGSEFYLPRFVRTRHELTGDLLKRTWPSIGAMGEPYVNLQFDSAGTKIFRGLTEKYAANSPRNRDEGKGRMLAIVLDGTLYSAPVLRSVIYDGSAQIEGIRSVLEATRLVKVLNAGSLPAPIKIIQKHEVDASLGQDSIKSGTRAVIFGGIAVLLFMMVYYMLCGVVADLALLLDLLLLPLGMVMTAGFLGNFIGGGASNEIVLPVLTLPGIAGILLTIGIAVDANVLIFERIREEMKSGKTIRGSVSAGYDRAFTTILDANITTLLTGIILFIWGSGPVRGFAVTLCGGIIVSLFTALVVTRLIFDISLERLRLTKLKMLSLIGDTKINFVGKRAIAGVLSVAVIASTWALLGMKYQKDAGSVFGVDFTDGTSVTFAMEHPDKKPAVADLRDALGNVGIKGTIQYKSPIGGSQSDEKLLVRLGLTTDGAGDAEADGPKSLSQSQAAIAAIQGAFPAAGFVKESEDAIGAQVGVELRRSAVWAIGLALIGIVIYISWRFRFSFAMGAIIALAHDVLITVGVYCVVFGRELSLPIIAALLTIVGYSVNDTIVVFDRIREDLKSSELRRTLNYKEICNLSINQTLSRTIMTSLTTLIAVGLLLLVGGGAINDFALALCIGVMVGTYSSIFVATPVMLLWHGDKPLPAKG